MLFSFRRVVHRVLPVALIPLALLVCASTPTAYPHAKRYLVAVMRVENQTAEKDVEPYLESVRSILISELVAGGRLRLIERDRVDVILKEQALGKTGLVETDSAMRIGRLLGAQAVLLVRVSALKGEPNVTTAGDASYRTLTVQASLDARLVHAETGEILAASEERSAETAREFSAGKDDVRTGRIDRPALTGHVLENGARLLARKLSALVPQK